MTSSAIFNQITNVDRICGKQTAYDRPTHSTIAPPNDDALKMI